MMDSFVVVAIILDSYKRAVWRVLYSVNLGLGDCKFNPLP